MAFAVAAPKTVAVPIAGSDDLFPVRRFYTIGGNYRQRMGDPEGPRPIMLKPADSVVPGGGRIAYPPMTQHLDHEVEMVVAIGKGGADISREAALDHVFGYAVMLDMVRFDLIKELRARGRPQDIAKAFVGGSPLSAVHPVSAVGHPSEGAVWLTVNGEERQRGDLADLVWDTAECIVQLSRLDRLEPGDLISTGTPVEPGPVRRGDHIHARVEPVGGLEVTIE